MLYPVNGARIYIADAPADGWGEVLPVAGWEEIGEAEALGMVGIEWEVTEAEVADCNTGTAQIQTAKFAQRPSPMQIVLGNDPEDAGQVILWRAAASTASYPFQLITPDGSVRSWWALVTSLLEVFDTANSVLKLQADLLPTGPISRERF